MGDPGPRRGRRPDRREFPVWFFQAGGEIMWGATARVLTELLCVVLGSRGPTIGPSELA